MTFKEIYDQVLRRFNSGLEVDIKGWIRDANEQLWAIDGWTFKRASLAVGVESGSRLVTGLPSQLGTVRGLLNQYGERLAYEDPDVFWRGCYGDSAVGTPDRYTREGELLYVAPTPGETAAWMLLQEMPVGYYVSSTTPGVLLPSATLPVASGLEFNTAGGRVRVAERHLVSYTGVSGNTLTGCEGGQGNVPANASVISLEAHFGVMSVDTDVPLFPISTHFALVLKATANGQIVEGDQRAAGTEDAYRARVEAMQRQYLVATRGEPQVWGSSLEFEYGSRY